MTVARRSRGTRTKAILVTAALLVATALLAASLTPSSGASAPTAGASATKTVEIKRFAYRPATLRIRRGGSVAFRNFDRVAHTATRRGVFDTRRIKPGRSAVVRFGRRGTFRYFCKLHPFMRGKVVVE